MNPLRYLPYPTIVVCHVLLPHSQVHIWEPGNEANTPCSKYMLKTYIFLYTCFAAWLKEEVASSPVHSQFLSLGVAWGWGWRGSGCHVTLILALYPSSWWLYLLPANHRWILTYMQTIQAIFVCTLILPRGNFHHHIQNSMCLSVMVLYLCTWVCFYAAIHLNTYTNTPQLCNHAHQVIMHINQVQRSFSMKVKQSESTHGNQLVGPAQA